MEFYNTVYGKRFFDNQLPALIKNLDRLVQAIEENNKLMQKNQQNKDDKKNNSFKKNT